MLVPESFLVIVKCMTFNHHAYIEDAMNGFCMQKTSFPYLCIVMDDCSTDGEQEVIKKYVDEHFNTLSTEETDDYFLNLCQHKTNENCYFAVFYLKYNHYHKKSKVPYYSRWQDNCKYIAYCEGDDYWIDAGKLQMQVHFLEENEEYGMCYTKAKKYVQNNKRFQKRAMGGKIDGFEDLLKNGNRIPTLTVCIRRIIWTNYMEDIKPSTRGWLMGDYPMWLYFANETKMKFFECESGVYRILEISASHNKDKSKIISFMIAYCTIQKFFLNYYNIEYTPIIIDYFFWTCNLDELKKINSSYLPLKYWIKKQSGFNIILWKITQQLFLLNYYYKNA